MEPVLGDNLQCAEDGERDLHHCGFGCFRCTGFSGLWRGDLVFHLWFGFPADAASSGWSLVCTVCLNRRQTEREMQFYKEFMEGNRSFAYYSGECTQYKHGRRFVFMEKKSFFWKD